VKELFVKRAAKSKADLPAIPASSPLADQIEGIDRIKHLPRELGVLLMVAGIGGMLLPGPVGAPFVLVSLVVLWPRAFERMELLFERRCPKTHRAGVRQIKRYVTDLERRYPSPPSSGSRTL
jgi:hypothetical protein